MILHTVKTPVWQIETVEFNQARWGCAEAEALPWAAGTESTETEGIEGIEGIEDFWFEELEGSLSVKELMSTSSACHCLFLRDLENLDSSHNKDGPSWCTVGITNHH